MGHISAATRRAVWTGRPPHKTGWSAGLAALWERHALRPTLATADRIIA